jgi:hypothetical protein
LFDAAPDTPVAEPTGIITSVEQLRALYKPVSDGALKKTIPYLDAHARNFIGLSPFLVLSTFDGAGNADASPRGDAPGFVRVMDERRLLIPDRPGNNRLDSLTNILKQPAVGLLFVVPGALANLRVNGAARIITDETWLAPYAEKGRRPPVGVLVEVKEVFLHCAKAMLRSKIWAPETWPSEDMIAPENQIFEDHLAINLAVAAQSSLAPAEV